MKAQYFVLILFFSLLINCASTSGVISDHNLEIDFNQYETYVLCIEDLSVRHLENPRQDNEYIRQLLADAVAIEMGNKGHRTNVLEPQLQAGFKILIKEETVQFKNCEHSKELEYWENCKIHEETYDQESLVVYVANFNTNEVLWHASIICDLSKSKRKLKSYINSLVNQLFDTYPRAQITRNSDDLKEL